MNYHFAKKHSGPKLVVTFMCKLCYQEFSGFYVSRQHKITHHGFPIKTANVAPDHMINDVVDHKELKEELPLCEYFLVDSELQRARHKVSNYAIQNLNTTID